MSFPRYPKYKDSGVDWLGDVPEHWEACRNKAVFIEVDDRSEDEEGELLTVSHITGVTPRSEKEVNMFLPETFVGYKRCQLGDLVINTMWAWMGALGCSPCDGIASPSYNVYRPRRVGIILPEFYDYLCRVPSHRTVMKAHSTGIWESRLRLYPVAFLSMSLALPSISEQSIIATFLDRETAKIDGLVAEQQRLVELLKEKRQAVISHAVTKGLNPRAPMKPSGIDWLGDVPEHWEVKKIKHLTSRISSGKTPLGGSEVYVDEGVTFLRSQNVYDEGLRLDDVVSISPAVDEAMAVSRVLPNDILLNITGASIGRSCVVPSHFSPANVNQHVCVIRLKDSAQVPFVGWLFKSATIKSQIDHAQNGAAREGLNFMQIGDMPIALPSAAEQRQIADFLNRETAKLGALTAEAERAIDLLQERRTALISAAVTGKIDVRDFAKSEAA